MLIDLGVETLIIDKAGAWLSYKGERIGQGRENAKVFLKEHPEIAQRIEAEVLEKKGLKAKDEAETGAEAPPEVTPVEKPVKEVKSRGGRLRARN